MRIPDSSNNPSIPNFEILGRIGGGAYGEVFLARSVTGMYRAVKVVSREDFEYEKTFEREFEGIQHYEQVSQDHPGLVDVLHVGRDQENGFYYYVMELADDVSGEVDEIDPENYEAKTLSSELRKRPTWAVSDTVNLGISLAGALGHLHLAGLTHRDVKPSNIIFVKGVPKLADVGLVAQSGQRTYVGTEGYVPPEGPGTSSADLYSLAMVLYQVHTGKDRLDFPELPTNLEIPPTVNRDEWRALNGVICRAGSPDPGKRYDTAHSFALALRKVIDEAMPAGYLRERKSSAGIVFVLTLLFLVALVGGGGYWLWKDNQSFLSEYAQMFTPQGKKEEVDPGKPVEAVDSGTPSVVRDPIEEEVVEDPPDNPKSHPKEEDKTAVAETTGDSEDKDSPKEEKVEKAPDKGDGGNEEAKEDSATKPSVIVADLVMGQVKVMSKPSGATVWIDGEEIGRTETRPLDLPVGSEEIILKHPDYRDTPYRFEVKEGFQLVDVELLPNRGPIPGNPWINSLGITFQQNNSGTYITTEAISMQTFDLFLSETNKEIPVTGFEGVAQVRNDNALFEFSDWMTRKDRERGYLGREQYHRPVRIGEASGSDAFYCILDNQFGSLILNSEPEGAEVTVNGEVRGETPLVLNDVRLGPYRLEFRAAGYQSKVLEGGPLENTEPVPATVTMERDASVVFGQPWTNSQGMTLHPVGDLMVAEFETRVSDYREYVTEARVGFMPNPGISQALNHPVAGVTLAEAEAFCRWLTQREQALGWIRPWQRYRVPTDLEWSRFVGESQPSGNTPGERAQQGGKRFPWGTEWPPPENVGNLADQAARPEFGNYVIEGYNDGFTTTAPVGSFPSAGNGLHDLCGNVWEWVSDPYSDDGSGLLVVRGGGWDSHEQDVLRTSYRNAVPPDTRQSYFGFRYVLEEFEARP